MRLQTDPSCFSITAFLADQVTLVARQEKLPPGAALLRLQELSRTPDGRAALMRLIEAAAEQEANPDEAAKIGAICHELAAWGYGEGRRGLGAYSGDIHRAAA
ncbi:hypothetical protein ABMY26_20910 [Azospirillum sp. HJ39]|uniref:hypothetical protein n=1 Tax=Azospirillum sp. HJ39 TaxID=3159496 RepID=UPI0035565589